MMTVSCCIYACRTVLLYKFPARELEITVFTNTTGDGLGGYVIQLCFNASQDDVTYRCRMNDLPFIPCKNYVVVKMQIKLFYK